MTTFYKRHNKNMKYLCGKYLAPKYVKLQRPYLQDKLREIFHDMPTVIYMWDNSIFKGVKSWGKDYTFSHTGSTSN